MYWYVYYIRISQFSTSPSPFPTILRSTHTPQVWFSRTNTVGWIFVRVRIHVKQLLRSIMEYYRNCMWESRGLVALYHSFQGRGLQFPYLIHMELHVMWHHTRRVHFTSPYKFQGIRLFCRRLSVCLPSHSNNAMLPVITRNWYTVLLTYGRICQTLQFTRATVHHHFPKLKIFTSACMKMTLDMHVC